MISWLSFAILAVCAVALFSVKVGAFEIIKPLVLCPEVHGVVLSEGKPMANIAVTRTLSWADTNMLPEKVVTDGQGQYSFPEVKKIFLSSLFPGEMVVNQMITLDDGQKQYDGWAFAAHGRETKSVPINIICDLSAEPQYSEDWYGVCRLINK